MNIVWRYVIALFALRALLPVGFMPDFPAGSHHGMTLVFCTMGGGKPHLMDMSGAAGKADSGKSTHHVGKGECAFAFAAAPALPTFFILCTSGLYAPEGNDFQRALAYPAGLNARATAWSTRTT